MSDTRNIRWGIIGAGGIARQFASDIRHAQGASLTAVATRGPAKAQAFAGDQGDVTGFGSLSEMLASGRIDAAYIATPNSVHHAQALACIAAGMPVLVEKPLTANLEAALEIEAAARQAGVFVMEAMWSRYLPAMQAARKAIRDGAIGTVRRLEADLAWKVDYNPSHRLFNKAQGGGALYDLGVYPISLARWFLGEPQEVSGVWRPAPSGVDMSAELTLQYHAAEARISCGIDRDGDNRMIIEGDKGVIVLGPLFIKATGFAIYPSRAIADWAQPGGSAAPTRLRRKLLGLLPLPGVKRHAFALKGSGLEFEIEAASNAIRQGLTEEPDNPLDETIANLRMIDTVLTAPPRRN
ncbi:Gfo/Idh/MocA family oxidoreductase [uncultured Hoeflea sp.]|uniref:Gfo/Idh/MocA family protein n=1 Tax=uncultured Hoeflea sp. TaxID=538666 RepID=UPI00260912F4|nr:Gfo/Idh/MocA family oxidoreductase [uncultured Hoeflea sp.]